MFLFAYNFQEPSWICVFMIFTVQIGKLTYKYHNVVAIYMQTQPYHKIYEIKIYQLHNPQV